VTRAFYGPKLFANVEDVMRQNALWAVQAKNVVCTAICRVCRIGVGAAADIIAIQRNYIL